TAQAGTAAEAASDTSSHIGTTAAATEELSAAISEIHGQATRSVGMAREAVSQADQTNATMRSLREAVEKIGSVVGLISDIAAQKPMPRRWPRRSGPSQTPSGELKKLPGR